MEPDESILAKISILCRKKTYSEINSLNDSQVPASTVIATMSRERTTIDDDEAAIGNTVAVRYCSWGTLRGYGRSTLSNESRPK